MMKKVGVLVILGVVLCGLLVSVSGCKCFPAFWHKGCEQMGESQAQGRRRHIDTARIHRQQLNEEIDEFFMIDEPSRLTEKRLP